ncbi:MAG: DUF4143 domain-containing protein [Treponema sp.]|jgi:hypothetical protein|nr:DUF4143 domain-containing protein [Treponema sp.]
MVKTLKLYFSDTVLVCFLLGWGNPTPLSRGPGGVICAGEEYAVLKRSDRVIPVFYL